MTESEETIVTVSFMDDDETATSTDTSNVLSEAADTVAPVVSDDNISVTGGSGTNGAFVSGDTVTVTWDNTELTGDANFDTIESVEVTFFGEYDVEATEDESVWTATLAIDDIEGTVEDDELGIVVRAYDDAGNSSSDDVEDLHADNSAPDLPVISPDGSTFSGSVNVTIESEDSDYIRYKTNGGAPNCESGTLYSGEFTLSQSATVKAIGCDDAGNGSSIATAEFTKQGGGSSGSKGTRTNKAKGNTPAAPSTQSPIAQGVKDLIEQNRALLTQAESMGIVLPQFIKDILSGATPTGATVRDLTIGSTGTDVTALQNILIGLGHAIPAGATGYFGTQTQSALAAYQSAHGVSPASGYFGALTRAFMKTAGVAGIWW